MNGAEALVRTLVGAGVTTCFTNPGTSEMHVVATLDSVPEFRAVLALFEGVATGAADGYARMADRPAATLLHLGPGLGNGLANLHNARKARVPLVNIVGDHATYHVRMNAPLQSDIETVARNVSSWVRTTSKTGEVGRDAAEAVAAAGALPGQVATLILPADVSWSEGAEVAAPLPAPVPQPVGSDVVSAIARVLRSGEPAALMLGRRALREPQLRDAARIAAATGAQLFHATFPTRVERGAGLPAVAKLPYLTDLAAPVLAHLKHLILVDDHAPVSFFAYPGKPGTPVPDGCAVHELAGGASDVAGALAALVDELGAADVPVPVAEAFRPDPPSGALDAAAVCQAVAATLPERAIIVDEALTSGFTLPAVTAGVPHHDVLTLTGGAIGQGLPTAVGAAVACPDRPVVSLQADGSGLYTIQALWTMARENLDVTVVLFNNRSYAILDMELNRVGAGTPGPLARAQFKLDSPGLDFVSLGQGFGVPSVRANDGEELVAALHRAYAEPGPHLIEVVIPPVL